MENKIDFPTWLESALEERGWNQTDLAKRSGITQGQISRLINGTRNPTAEVVSALAQAFHLTPEIIFRIAGLLPPDKPINEANDELISLFDRLTPDDQDEILQLARIKVERHNKTHEKPTPRINHTAPQTDAH